VPRFNAMGQVTPQIGYFWYDQSRFIFQDCSSGACILRLSDGHEEAPRGCNELTGNGAGAWAAWLSGFGLFDSFGRHFPDSGLAMDGAQIAGAMGPDGSCAIKVLRNSYGPWDVLMPDNSRWRLTNGDARDIQILSGRRAIWSEQGYVRGNFPLIGRPNVPVYAPRVADDGTLLYQDTTGRLVLGGKVIAPASAAYFYPDVLLLDGLYHVTWSPSQNDTNAQFLTFTPERLASLPPVTDPEPEPPVPPDPEPPEPPDPEPEPPHPPDPEPEPPQPDIPPALPGEDIMTPTPAALQMGAFFARVDLTPSLAPWPGWFLVHFDRTDPSDAGCRFTLSQPQAGGRLKVTLDAVPGSLLSADAGEHGGGVCKQFYLKPTDDWGFNEQFSGWQLGSGGPEIVLVQYQGDGAGQLSACLKVVRL